MSILLTNTDPPLGEVSQLCGTTAMAIYAFLWNSARKDVRYDHRKDLPWQERRDSGGTTYWSIKGISKELKITRPTTNKAINTLLDNGFISIAGYTPSGNGSDQTILRVTHPEQLPAVRYAIKMMVKTPSQLRAEFYH